MKSLPHTIKSRPERDRKQSLHHWQGLFQQTTQNLSHYLRYVGSTSTCIHQPCQFILTPLPGADYASQAPKYVTAMHHHKSQAFPPIASSSTVLLCGHNTKSNSHTVPISARMARLRILCSSATLALHCLIRKHPENPNHTST